MPVFHNITQFLSFDVPGNDCRWLAQKDWSEEQIDYFYHYKCNHYSSLIAPPPVHHRKTPVANLRAQLILQTNTKQSIGTAIVHSYTGHFACEHIVTYFEPQISKKEKLEAVKSLVTACFFITQTDQLRLFHDIEDSLIPTWGDTRTLGIIKPKRLNDKPIKQILSTNCVVISSHEWNNCEVESPIRSSLMYLQTLGIRHKKENEPDCTCTKPKRSFLARLFRPKIDDSIF